MFSQSNLRDARLNLVCYGAVICGDFFEDFFLRKLWQKILAILTDKLDCIEVTVFRQTEEVLPPPSAAVTAVAARYDSHIYGQLLTDY